MQRPTSRQPVHSLRRVIQSSCFRTGWDALTHDGPGDPSRLDLSTICQQIVTPGLSLDDVIATEGTIVVAAVAILTYDPKFFAEPAIMSYAASSFRANMHGFQLDVLMLLYGAKFIV